MFEKCWKFMNITGCMNWLRTFIIRTSYYGGMVEDGLMDRQMDGLTGPGPLFPNSQMAYPLTWLSLLL